MMENILIYHYDNDDDIVFDGLVTNALDLSIMVSSLRYNCDCNVYSTNLSYLSNEISECKKDSNIKYLMFISFIGVECNEPIITYKAFHKKLNDYYDRLQCYRTSKGYEFVFTKVIDRIDDECSSDALKNVYELFKSLRESLEYIKQEKNRNTYTESDIEYVVNTIDLLMNNNERERRKREDEEKLINEEKELLISLLNKYGIPSEYLGKYIKSI